MQLLIDSIYEFYNNAENLTAFDEWRKKKYENKNTTIKESSQINGLGVRDILSQLVYHFKERK